MSNLIVLDEKDNVAVVSDNVKMGEKLRYTQNNNNIDLIAINDVPIYHKISIKDINKSEDIIKYGEKIGSALENILVGEYVHTHNVGHY